jgi:hypothetical protein
MAVEKRYVIGGTDGWLRVKREPSGVIVSMPQGLQVELINAKDGRDFFKPLEGLEKDKLFSVLAGNLGKTLPAYRGPARLTFSLEKKQLSYGGNTATAHTHDRYPISVGNHPIQLPDFPHAGGQYYMSITPFAKVWFYLGMGAAVPGLDDRYLHPGVVSLGCVTVEPKDWTALYNHIILCRAGDGKNVGTLTVVR